jgi:hypothetical protein
MDNLILILWMVIAVLGFVLWLIMLSILRRKGIAVNYFIVSPFDYYKFWNLIRIETRKRYSILYLIIFWLQVLLIVFSMVCVLLFF